MKNLLLCILALIMLSSLTYGQVTVTGAAVGNGTYTSLTNASGAFAAINGGTQTGSNIVITITADVTTEAGTNSLNAGAWTSLTINPVGARVISGTVGGAPLINLNGADYVTINGLNDGTNSLTISNLSTAATTLTSTIRFIADATNNLITNCTILGSATVPLATNGGNIFFHTATTTGNDNNTISNCKLGPAGTNLPSKLIYGNGTTTNATTANSGILINNCEFYDYFLTGGCGAVYVSSGNTDWSITNNKIYQTASRTFTSSGTMNGIYFANSTYGNNIQITGNTIGFSSSTGTGTLTLLGSGVAGSFQGIYMNAMTTAALACNINNNIVSDISLTSSTGTFYAIYNATGASSNTININNNQVKNISMLTTTGSGYGIWWTSATNMTITGNTVHDITRSGAGTFACIYSGSSSTNETISSNTIYNITSTAAGASTLRGIYQGTASGTKVFQNNTIYNFSGLGGTTIYGLYVGYGTTCDLSGNVIYGFTSTGGTGGTVAGIYTGSSYTTMNLYKNKIYGLTSSSTGPSVYGIYVGGGTTNNITNNLVGDLTATAANSAIPLAGIYVAGGTNANVYYNTVYLNSVSSGALFGSTAMYASTTPTLDMRNNIFVNLSRPMGAGITSAYRRSSTTLTTYGASSNNNLFYAGTPTVGANVIFTDGTNSDTYIADFKTRVTPRDAASITENPTFVSMTGSNIGYLHISPSVATGIESGAVNIATYTDDFDSQVRQGNAGYTGTGTAPDIGADEFEGITLPTVTINTVSANPSGNACVATARTITANTTAGASNIVSVVLNYAFNGASQTPITMTGGSVTGTSNWTATIPVASPTTATVTWSVTATDAVLAKTKTGTSYADEPLNGATAAASASASPVCSGAPSVLSCVVTKSGTFSLGAGASTSAAKPATMFPYNYGGAKTQYLIKATELTALGLTAGTLTQIGFEVTVSGQAYPGFAISMGNTALSAMTTSFVTGLTDVYYNASFTPAVGINTFTLSPTFSWDGVSNVVISFCWSTGLTTAASSTLKVDDVGFTAAVGIQIDSKTPAEVCATTTGGTTGTSRPKFYLTGDFHPTMSSYSWSDGSTVIGTTNPLTVYPLVNTTYTVSAYDANGCYVTANTTVNTTSSVIINSQPQPLEKCAGLSATFTVSASGGGLTYQWQKNGVNIDGVANPSALTNTLTLASISAGDAGAYSCVISSTCSAPVNSDPATLTVLPAPSLVVTPPSGTICLPGGAAVTLTAAGGVSYAWAPATGLSATTGDVVVANPASTTTYTVTATGENGCSSTLPVTVSVLKTITMNSVTATPTDICSGGSTVLTASATIPNTYTYCVPTASGGNCVSNVVLNTLNSTVSCSSPYYHINSATGSNTTTLTPGSTYSLTVSTAAAAIVSVWIDFNNNGTFDATEWFQPYTNATTGTISITVPANAVQSVTGMRVRSRANGNTNGSGDACSSFGSGSTEDYWVTIGSPSAGDYTWSPSLNLSSPTGASVTATNLLSTTVFNVTASATGYCPATGSVTVNIAPLTCGELTLSGATTCVGIQKLTAHPAGGGLPYTYAWKEDGVLMASTSSEITTNAGTHIYECIVTDACLSTCSQTMTVTTHSSPIVGVTASASLLCIPSATPITLTASGATTYAWSPATGLSGTTGDVVTANPSVTTTYTVTGTDGNGCLNTSNTTITVAAAVILNATATPSVVCTGNNSQLLANATQSYNTALSLYSFAGSAGTYTPITGTTLGSGAIGDDVGIGNLDIGFSFIYNNNTYTKFGARSNGLIELGQTNVTLSSFSSNALASNANCIAPFWDDNNTTGGSIIYSLTGSAPNRVLTVQWTGMHVGGSGSATNTTLDCQIMLYETTGVIQFVYGPTSGTLSATASIGISGAVGSYWSVTPLLPANTSTVSSSTENSTIASEANIPSGTTYTFTPPAAPVLGYLWTPSTFMTPGAETTYNPLLTNVTSNQTYSITVSGQGGCSANATVPITVAAYVTMTGQPAPLTKCVGESATFTVSAVGGGLSYQWQKNGVNIDGGTNATALTNSLVLSSVALSDGGSYRCVVSSTCSSPVNSDAALLTVNAIPTATASSNSPVCTGGNINLTGTTDIGTTYTWTGPNGFSSAVQNPSISGVTSNAAGVYSFTTSKNGCTSTTSTTTVVVNPTPSAVSVNPATPIVAPGTIMPLVASGGIISGVTLLSEDINAGAPTWPVVSDPTSPTACNWAPQTSPYVYSSTTYSSHNGGKFMVANADVGGSGTITNTMFTSPVFSTSGYTTLSLTFEHYYKSWSSGDHIVAVEVSTNGTDWTTLQSYMGTTTGSPTNFATANLSLDAYVGKPSVQIRFNFNSTYGYYWMIDDVKISGSGVASTTWAPFTYLYNTSSALPGEEYTGAVTTTVYMKPTAGITYTATATSSAGCTSTGTSVVSMGTSWTGAISTNWNVAGNWNPAAVPGASTNVGIPLVNNLPEISTTGNLCNTLWVQNGASVTINPNADLTAMGATKLEGPSSLIIKATANGMGSFIDNGTITYTTGASAKVERYIPAYTGTNACYVSSPISNATREVFTGAAGLWEYNSALGSWAPLTINSTALDLLKGYVVRFATNTTLSFIGTLNTGTQTAGTPNHAVLHNGSWGWNLMGNAYPSAIDVNTAYWNWGTDINPYVVFRFNDGSVGYYSTDLFYGFLGGTNIIPSTQAYWINLDNTNSITMYTNNADRVHNQQNIYKSATDENRFVSISSFYNGKRDETVIGFSSLANNDYDRLDIDKMMLDDPNYAMIFSLQPNNRKIALNCFAPLDGPMDVALGYRCQTEGNITFSVNLDQFDQTTSVTLEDTELGIMQDLRANPVYSFNSSVVTNYNRFIVHFGTARVTGQLTYANTNQTAIAAAQLELLNQSDETIASTQTNGNGDYLFTKVASGPMHVNGTSSLTPGGFNSTDALQVLRHFTGMINLSGIYAQAADVDGSGVINSTDALLIQKRFVGMVNSFHAGNWVIERKDVEVTTPGMEIVNKLKALCYGDVNGSFTPMMKSSGNTQLVENGQMNLPAFVEVEVPVYAMSDINLGALTLVLNIPSGVEVKGFRMAVESGNLVTNILQDQLIISWTNLNGMNLSSGQVLGYLKVISKGNPGNFTLDGATELANTRADVLNLANIGIPSFKNISSTGTETGITCYPNPAVSFTTFTYGLNENSEVNITIYNAFGQEVQTLVNGAETSGTHQVDFTVGDLPTGAYLCKMLVKSASGSVLKTRIFEIVK